MSQKTFSLISGLVFVVVTLAHLSRIVFHWELILAGWPVPVALNWVAMFISGYLAYEGLRLSRSGQ
jgi:hypothetical protein